MLSRVWDALRTPFWAGRIVFLVGAVTLASAVLPAFRDRTELVNQLVPDVFPAAATTDRPAALYTWARASMARARSRAFLAFSLSTCTTWPSATWVTQAGMSLGAFSTSTRHIRHTAGEGSDGW